MKTFLKYFLILGLFASSCAAITPEEQQKQMNQLLEVVKEQQKALMKTSEAPKSSLLQKSAAVVATAGLGYLAFSHHKIVQQNAELRDQIAGLSRQMRYLHDDFAATTFIQMMMSAFGFVGSLSASAGVHRLLQMVRNRG